MRRSLLLAHLDHHPPEQLDPFVRVENPELDRETR
jgi:hypothetical protein